MAAHFLKPCQGDPDHPIRRRVGEFHDAHHHIGFSVLLFFVKKKSMIGMKGVPRLQAKLSGGKSSHHCFSPGGIKPSPSLPKTIRLSATILGFGEQFRQYPDQSKSAIIVPHGDGNRLSHTRMLADLLIVLPGQVARRGFHMKNGIENQLEFGGSCSQDGVESGMHPGKGRIGLVLDHPDRKDQTTRQGNGDGSDRGGQQVLPETLEHDAQDRHVPTSLEARFHSARSRQVSKASRTLRS